MLSSISRYPLRLNSICQQPPSQTRRLWLLGQEQFCRVGCPAEGKNSRLRTSRMMTTLSSEQSFVADPPQIVSLPVVGSESRFPVRRVYCVGKNYADHVVEMGGDLKRSLPVFFTKPSYDGVLYAGGKTSTAVLYPPNTQNLHYEVELVVAIGKELVVSKTKDNDSASSISAGDLLDCVYGYAVGIDFTRRDLQGEAKKKGLPWDTGKYFDQSAPMGSITPKTAASSFEDTLDLMSMELTVNGETRQSVRLNQMIWKVPEILTELSGSFALKPGDLIMTGTPSGVGPVVVGDRLVGTIDGLVEGVDITLV